MLERDRFLVSYASVVLAVYNGEKRGGTAATLRYARKLGRELIVIDPATLTVNHETEAAPGPARMGRGKPRLYFPARMCGNKRPTGAAKPCERHVRPNAQAGGRGLGVLPNERFGIVKTISRNIARRFYGSKR